MATQGICRVCGQFTDLTFEHIPPRSAFNCGRVRSIDLGEWLRRDDLDYAGGRIQQRGMGAEVLCGRCNSFLGRQYVSEYRAWARWGMHLLKLAPPDANAVVATVSGRKPLRFLKQCVAMVMCSNSPAFVGIHPALQKFVLDVYKKGLPDKYDTYLTLFRGARARSSSWPCNLNCSLRRSGSARSRRPDAARECGPSRTVP